MCWAEVDVAEGAHPTAGGQVQRRRNMGARGGQLQGEAAIHALAAPVRCVMHALRRQMILVTAAECSHQFLSTTDPICTQLDRQTNQLRLATG